MKHCPICHSETWNYDVIEYGTGWTFCGDCFKEAKRSGLFDKIEQAIKEARPNYGTKNENAVEEYEYRQRAN